MTGRRCTYKNCTQRRNGGTHMFRYPVSNTARCQQWLMNAEKLDFLNLKEPQLKNKVICQYHFRNEDFQSLKKNRLKLNTVPTLDGPYCDSMLLVDTNTHDQHNIMNEVSLLNENEIEIEEHDVLDNPVIKRIFPDLSIIKKEISMYEEGLIPNDEQVEDEILQEELKPSVKQPMAPNLTSSLESLKSKHKDTNPVLSEISCQTPTSEQTLSDIKLATHLRFKMFLDSLVDDFSDIADNSSDNQFTDIQCSNDYNFSQPSKFSESEASVKDYTVIKNNMIILGSKSSVKYPKKSSREIRPVKLVLNDVSTFLNESKQYCRQCLILFPNVPALNWHTDKVHCPKKKNFMASNKCQLKLKSINVKFQCEICFIKFSSKGNLNKHNRRFHTKKNPNIGNSIIQKTTLLQREILDHHSKSQLVSGTNGEITDHHYCSHCSKLFQTRNDLIEHLYDIITPNKTISSTTTESKQNSDTSHLAGRNTNEDNIFRPVRSTRSLKLSTSKDPDEHSTQIKITNKTISVKSSVKRNSFPQTCSVDQNKTNITLNENAVQQAHKPMDNIKENVGCAKSNRPTAELKKYMEIDNIDTDIVDLEWDIENGTGNSDNNSDYENSLANTDITEQEKQVYQCLICSKYIRYFKCYFVHMENHNIEIETTVDKTTFHSQCKFCNSRHANIKSYNKHLLISHLEKNNKKMKLDNKAFQSVLFECVKCNINFLSATAAQDHSEHKHIIINWNCPKCQKTFKANDKPLHLKQHSTSDTITTYAIFESALRRLLCKCLKCAVHFSEDEFFLHAATCESEAPNSVYCNKCDILINRNDMMLHEHNHKYKEMVSSDFTIVESTFLLNKVKSKVDVNTNAHTRSKFALTYCYTCNCFVSDIGSTRKAHIEARCGVICHRMCKKCGLVFTNRGYLSHKMLHEEVKNLTLQAFHFYDIETKTKMQPPMPKYPNCNICEVHFLNKQAVKQHECKQQKFTICSICKIKLTEAAFRLHMKFHNYKMSRAWNKRIIVRYKHDDPEATSVISSKSKLNINNPVYTVAANTSDTSFVQQNNFLYTCSSCHIVVDNYDKVVQHCQQHYDYKEMRPNEEKGHRETFPPIITFDPFYFRFDNDVWIKHIFVNLTEKDIKMRIENSIYKFECRLKMEEIQVGPPNLILYKCDVCGAHVEPNMVYSHAGTICSVDKDHPCSHCSIRFCSADYRLLHEKIHERPGINIASHKIVLFNKIEHQLFTKIMYSSLDKFIFYQCRNCDSIIDKLQRDYHDCYNSTVFKCTDCGLLFYEQEYNSHLVKHRTVSQFKTENMVVVMFGKLALRKNVALKSTFSGTIYDLIFYKCAKCGLCLGAESEIRGHICVTKSNKSVCPKCLLCFLKTDLDSHLQLHENNIELEYSDFCSNIVPFNLPSVEKNVSKPINVHLPYSIPNENNKISTEKLSSCIRELIYKCACGLHFLEKYNLSKHRSTCQTKVKISKQNCFRCDLLFTPSELFNHLLKHHSNKKVKYEYDIISTL